MTGLNQTDYPKKTLRELVRNSPGRLLPKIRAISPAFAENGLEVFQRGQTSLPSIKQSASVRLTAQEFKNAVLAQKPRTAIFDCDGTLWKGDSGSGFMDWSLERGLVSRNASDWIHTRYRDYKQGTVSELAICGEMVQIYAGLREQELRSAVEEYFDSEVKPNLFPEMQELVLELQKSGTDIWAVSSTNNWVVEAGVKLFGIPPERVLAACVKVENGVITSELIAVPTDEGKAESLRKAGLPNPDAVFGNSIHDAAMLEIAKSAYAVNPSQALQELAAQKGWTTYFPSL